MSLLLFHQVIDAMDFAVYAYDVEHVIVDNLQVGQSVPFDFAVRLFSPCPPPRAICSLCFHEWEERMEAVPSVIDLINRI